MSRASFGLYVHIPFCAKKCPYCDFNSYATDARSPGFAQVEENYTDALIGELRAYAKEAPWKDRSCATIFFGGGTPSIFQANSITRFLDTVREVFPLQEAAEITLEANPGTLQERVDAEKLSGFRAAGVNRVSLGAQSFSADKLRFLGRIHGPEAIGRAVSAVREAQFENFNLDLIFGTSTETVASWRDELRQALALAPAHISAYGLTIEPGTEFGRLAKRGVEFANDEEDQANEYEYTQRYLTQEGFVQYELSNYARPGFECAHNLNYWRRGDYLGLGAGAHSFSSTAKDGEPGFGRRWSNIPGPQHYVDRISASGQAVQRSESLDRGKAELEFLSLGLRTSLGVSESGYRDLFGEELEGRYSRQLRSLAEIGLLQRAGDQVSLTPRGFLFADTVFEAFAE